MKEMNVKEKIVFIADKGFFSAENVAMMDEEKLSYIIPLKRNNSLINYSPLERGDFKKEMQYFFFQDRIIWFYAYGQGNYKLITFLDEALRIQEEKDYLSRIGSHPEAFSKNKFDEKLHHFGTLTIVHEIEIPKKKNTAQKRRKNRNRKNCLSKQFTNPTSNAAK